MNNEEMNGLHLLILLSPRARLGSRKRNLVGFLYRYARDGFRCTFHYFVDLEVTLVKIRVQNLAQSHQKVKRGLHGEVSLRYIQILTTILLCLLNSHSAL